MSRSSETRSPGCGIISQQLAVKLSQQLVDAFPWDTAPRYLLRDRDSCYGEQFHSTTRAMGIHEVLTSPRSPWQNAFVARLIGSIRREILDHILILNARGLRRILKSYFDYYGAIAHALGTIERRFDSAPCPTVIVGKDH